MAKIKSVHIQLDDPCHEDWNKMTPTQQGRFCASCTKEVIDFTQLTDAQVIEYVQQNGIHFCGRFRPTQLDRPIEKNAVPVLRKWWKAAAAILSIFSVKNSYAQGMPEIKDSCFTGENVELSYTNPSKPTLAVRAGNNCIVKGKVTLDGHPLNTCTISVFANNELIHTTQADSAGQYEIKLDTALLREITIVQYLAPGKLVEKRSFYKSDLPSLVNVDFVPARGKPISMIPLGGSAIITMEFKLPVRWLGGFSKRKQHGAVVKEASAGKIKK